MRRVLIAAVSLWLVVCAAGADPAFEGSIKVRADARVAGDQARLSDIAQLQGTAVEFAGIQIARKLAPGETRRLDGYTILRRLQSAGVDLQRTAYEIPVSVAVTRTFQEVSREQIRQAVEDYLNRQESPLAGAEIRKIEYQHPVRLPSGPYRIEIAGEGGSLRRGRIRLGIEFLREGKVIREVPATVALGIYGEGYFVKRAMERGEIISRSDIVVKKRDLSQLPVDAISSAGQAVGMKAARLLRPDLPLTLSDLAPPTLVRKGSPVTLVVETDNVKITTKGVAREDGSLGKKIRVVNKESGRELLGRVAGGSVVVVDF